MFHEMLPFKYMYVLAFELNSCCPCTVSTDIGWRFIHLWQQCSSPDCPMSHNDHNTIQVRTTLSLTMTTTLSESGPPYLSQWPQHYPSPDCPISHNDHNTIQVRTALSLTMTTTLSESGPPYLSQWPQHYLSPDCADWENLHINLLSNSVLPCSIQV